MHSALSTIALAVAPVAGTCMVAGALAGVAQVGFTPSPTALKPDFRRINPVSGCATCSARTSSSKRSRRSPRSRSSVPWRRLALLPGLTQLAALVGITPGALGVLVGRRALEIAQHAAFAYLLIGLLDYAWKRRRNEQQLKMTKQEVKDEARQYGVSAEVKAALRRRQMQAARARMMAASPTPTWSSPTRRTSPSRSPTTARAPRQKWSPRART